MKSEKLCRLSVLLLIFALSLFRKTPSAVSADITDYCMVPPFIQATIQPNLLLMFDNSSSMFDLNYIDKGTSIRPASYCYDQTYKGVIVSGKVTNPYEGYFAVDSYYLYNQANGYFTEVTPPDTTFAACSKNIPQTLCIGLDATTPKTVNTFIARGNYLNWLTASKFDVQKAILTGGKYSGGNLIAESRGCVGRGYIKEALTADYVEGGTNTSLGITFSVKGAPDPVNFTAPSRGGQSYLYIYEGDYNAGNCQTAINLYSTCTTVSCQNDLKAATAACLNITNIQDLATKSKVVFQQTVQECLQYNSNGTVGNDAVQTVVGGGQSVSCTTIYSGRAQATASCVDGPSCIKAGDADLLCSDDYVGACFNGAYDGTTKTWSDIWTKTTNIDGTDYSGNACIIKKHNQYCGLFSAAPVTDPTDDPSTTSISSNAPAILSDLGVEGQLKSPLLLSTGGADKIAVKMNTTEPSGLIQEYASRIRLGALAFNYNGSLAECGSLSTDTIQCPKICSGGTARSCGSVLDCDTYNAPAGTCGSIQLCKTGNTYSNTACTSNSDCNSLGQGYTCGNTAFQRCSNNASKSCAADADCGVQLVNYSCVADTTNKDAAKIYHYVGQGTCSNNASLMCAKNEQCGSGNTCNLAPVGVCSNDASIICTKSTDCGSGNTCRTHHIGIVKVIDDLAGATWTPFAEAFYDTIGYFAKASVDASTLSTTDSRSDLRINAGDFAANMNPSQFVCQSNNVLLISDGASTADRRPEVSALATLYNDGDGNITTTTAPATDCPKFKGSKNVDDLAWLGKKRNINKFSLTAPASTTLPLHASEYLSTYVVFSGADNGETGECNSTTLMSQTATNGGTTLLNATNSSFSDLKAKIKKALDEIAAGSASGTAASILSNSEGSGANLIQAMFYPKKYYENGTSVNWSGELQNLWYYVDPLFGNSTIREDTDSNITFDIAKDKVIRFYFDTATNQTKATRLNFDGTTESVTIDDPVTGVKSIWNAGKLLWERDPDTRTIYYRYSGILRTLTLADYDVQKDVLRLRLQAEGADNTAKDLHAKKIINFVRGSDECRTGALSLLSSNAACTSKSRSRSVSLKTGATTFSTPAVWKLGDIVSSTPKIQGNTSVAGYDQKWPLGYEDTTYSTFVKSANYSKRGMVYVGANDGMLHAFKLGNLTVENKGTQKGHFTGTNLGKEEWAYVPRHAFSYLKYLMLPDYDTNRLYYVDGANTIFDVAIEGFTDNYWNVTRTASSWRTVLLGGMGLGGSSKSKNPFPACTAGTAAGTCVKNPDNPGIDWGFSSYFALDITDQDYNTNDGSLRSPPASRWEFPANSDVGLGFATSGPALIRISAKTAGVNDNTKNGRWLAVFASGPTGPIDIATKQFKGKSDQTLKLFIVDIGGDNNFRVLNSNYWVIDTGITEAFAGSISNNVVVDAEMTKQGDPNLRQDDAVYIGYVKKAADGTWTDGGVLRMLIPDTTDPDNMNPTANWPVKKLIDGIGPVTTSVAKLMSKNNLYLFFGTGRYYYPLDDMPADSSSVTTAERRRLYMVKDPCYPKTVTVSGVTKTVADIDSACSVAAYGLSDLTNRTDGDVCTTSGVKGWYINLDSGERVVTDTVATIGGALFYTTFKPTADICGFGGSSYVWGIKYDTGCSLPAASKKGKALVQLSTGSFAELDLSTVLTDKGGRRTGESGDMSIGKAATDAGLFMTSAGLNPVKRILHIQERYK